MNQKTYIPKLLESKTTKYNLPLKELYKVRNQLKSVKEVLNEMDIVTKKAIKEMKEYKK